MSLALQRFRASMSIDYEKWHDGVGYDLEAIAAFDDRDRREAERLLVPRAAEDWRDLEALDRLGTPRAIKAIIKVRKHKNPETRLRAHDYGPPPTQAEWDAALTYAWPHVEPYSGLTLAKRCSVAHPSPAVVEAVWRQVREPSVNAYHAAETLCLMAGVIPHEYDFTYREIYLRLNGPKTADRDLAVEQIRALCSKILPT